MNLFKSQAAQPDDDALQRRSPSLINPESYDPVFYAEMLRLHEFHVLSRWGVVLLLWFVLGSLSLWRLRSELVLMAQHFTWPALRYALAFHPLASLGLVLCVGPTIGVLFWQSRNILLGLPKHELKRLEEATQKIRQQGTSHPLWNLVCRPSQNLGLRPTMQSDGLRQDDFSELDGSSDRSSEFHS